MKKLLIILALALNLAGCATTDVKPVAGEVVRYKYIINTLPVQLFMLPEQVPKLNTQTMNNEDIEKWMFDNEIRAVDIQERLRKLKTLQEQKIADTKKKLNVPPEDIIIN